MERAGWKYIKYHVEPLAEVPYCGMLSLSNQFGVYQSHAQNDKVDWLNEQTDVAVISISSSSVPACHFLHKFNKMKGWSFTPSVKKWLIKYSTLVLDLGTCGSRQIKLETFSLSSIIQYLPWALLSLRRVLYCVVSTLWVSIAIWFRMHM